MNLEQKIQELTDNILKDNPTITLADGATLPAGDLDFDNEAHFNAFAFQFEDRYKALITSNRAKSAKKSANADLDALLRELEAEDDEDDLPSDVEETREEKQKTQIDSLSTEIAKLQQRLKKGFNVETWKQLSERTAQVTDLKNRYRREQNVKELQRKDFLKNSFGSEQDFQRLWNSKLRDEVMQREAENRDSLRKAASHPLYRSAFSQS